MCLDFNIVFPFTTTVERIAASLEANESQTDFDPVTPATNPPLRPRTPPPADELESPVQSLVNIKVSKFIRNQKLNKCDFYIIYIYLRKINK